LTAPPNSLPNVCIVLFLAGCCCHWEFPGPLPEWGPFTGKKNAPMRGHALEFNRSAFQRLFLIRADRTCSHDKVPLPGTPHAGGQTFTSRNRFFRVCGSLAPSRNQFTIHHRVHGQGKPRRIGCLSGTKIFCGPPPGVLLSSRLRRLAVVIKIASTVELIEGFAGASFSQFHPVGEYCGVGALVFAVWCRKGPAELHGTAVVKRVLRPRCSGGGSPLGTGMRKNDGDKRAPQLDFLL